MDGYRIGSDQAITFPVIWYWADPSHFHPNDILATVAPQYYSFIWPILGGVARWDFISVYALVFIAFLALKILSLNLIFLIARAFAPSGAFISVGLLFLNHRIPGTASAIYHGNYFNSQLVALPFLLLAVLLFVRGRRLVPFLILGLAGNLHLMSAVQGSIVLFVALLWLTRRQLLTRETVILLIKIAASTIVGILPLGIWIFFSQGLPANQFLVSEPWLGIIQMRDRYIFPSLWPFTGPSGVGRSFLLLVVIDILILKTDVFSEKIRRIAAALLFGFASLSILGFVGTDIVPLAPIIAMQLFRGLSLLWILTGILVGGYIASRWHQNPTWFSRFALIILGLSFGLSLNTASLAAAAFIALAIELVFCSPNRLGTSVTVRKKTLAGILLGSAAMILLLGYRDLYITEVWIIVWFLPTKQEAIDFSQICVAVAVILAFGTSSRVFQLAGRIPDLKFGPFQIHRRGKSLLSATGIVLLILGVFWQLDPKLDRLPAVKPDESNPRVQVALWARDQTEPGSLFLVPPDFGDFGLFSRRNAIFTTKAGALVSFNQSFAELWDHRRALMEDYDSKGSYELNKMAEAYGASFVIQRKSGTPAGILPVYENREYLVYQLEADAE